MTPQEHAPIRRHIAYNLMQQNHSPEAKKSREAWNNNRLANNLYFFWGCGDARMLRLLTEETMFNNTIGNGGKAERMQNAVERAKLGLVVAHLRCGALSAKTDQVKNGIYLPTEDDVNQFVSKEIQHPSPLQACMQAEILAKHTKTEIAAMLQDPIDGSMEVLAIFNRKDGGTTSHIDPRFYSPTNKQTIPTEQIPFLLPNEYSSEVTNYLAKFDLAAQQLFTDFPTLSHEQAIQNPEYFGSSDSLKPQETRYPQQFRKPNTMFRSTIPRIREEKSTGESYTIVDQEDLRVARRQAQYVTSQATDNREKPHAPFRDTRVALFEASTYQQGLDAALECAKHPTMRPFFLDEGNTFIIAENKAGEILRMGEFKFTYDGHLTLPHQIVVFSPDK